MKQLRQLKGFAERVRLRPDERARVRTLLQQFMLEHPISAQEHPRLHEATSRAFRPLSFALRGALVGCLCLVLVGGTVLTAEASLPGDVLYPVKIHVNENVRGALLFTDESRAGWEARRMERRLDELVLLAEGNRLDARKAAVVETQIELQEEQTRRHAELLARHRAFLPSARVEIQVESSIRASQARLKSVQEYDEEHAVSQGAPIREQVERLDELLKPTEDRARLEGDQHDEREEARRRVVEVLVENVETRVTAQAAQLPPASVSDIQEKIRLAKGALMEEERYDERQKDQEDDAAEEENAERQDDDADRGNPLGKARAWAIESQAILRANSPSKISSSDLTTPLSAPVPSADGEED